MYDRTELIPKNNELAALSQSVCKMNDQSVGSLLESSWMSQGWSEMTGPDTRCS